MKGIQAVFIVFNHVNACPSMHLLVEIHNIYMTVPTYLIAQNVHGPRFNTPF